MWEFLAIGSGRRRHSSAHLTSRLAGSSISTTHLIMPESSFPCPKPYTWDQGFFMGQGSEITISSIFVTMSALALELAWRVVLRSIDRPYLNNVAQLTSTKMLT